MSKASPLIMKSILHSYNTNEQFYKDYTWINYIYSKYSEDFIFVNICIRWNRVVIMDKTGMRCNSRPTLKEVIPH